MTEIESNPYLATQYLQMGNPTQQKLFSDLEEWKILKGLHGFKPLVAGTIPLGIDTTKSDVDILVQFNLPVHLIKICYAKFRFMSGFHTEEKNIENENTILVRFHTPKFRYEIFGQKKDPTQQTAWIHMMVEAKILNLANEDFRQNLIDMKQKGTKTEIAFAHLLGFKSKPFEAIKNMKDWDDEKIRNLLKDQNFIK
ncbi:DUF4269 domain-containing protein [Leptospira sp. 96542]|nr:DUF4269 domain-containing protein [Leptospira sp. 96542]